MNSRHFTHADQIEFASLSHDYNPIHVDPIASRRLIYGQQVVHGVNALLWAIARFADGNLEPIKILSLTCSFKKPVLLNENVTVHIESYFPFNSTIRLRQFGQVVTKISFEFATCNARELEEFNEASQNNHPFATQPDLVTEADLPALSGEFTIGFNTAKIVSYYGLPLFAALGSQVIAEIIALTKVVGMHAPGLNSLFTELKLNPSSGPRQTDKLHYKSQEYDQRFRQLIISCNTKTFDANLKALYRPAAVEQETYSVLKQSVFEREFASQRALVIGGSRGLGEVTAKYLAAGGAHVLLTYSLGMVDANLVVNDITLNGGNAKSIQFDVSSFSFEDLGLMDEFSPTHIYFFATPFVSPGEKYVFSSVRLMQFLNFYLTGFQKIIDHFSKRGTRNYFWPSSVYLDYLPPNMGEYCVAKSAVEAYCGWLVKNKSYIRISHPRLPRLLTDHTATIAVTENGDTSLMLGVLRDFTIDCQCND